MSALLIGAIAAAPGRDDLSLLSGSFHYFPRDVHANLEVVLNLLLAYWLTRD